jgi:hypothetical protein
VDSPPDEVLKRDVYPGQVFFPDGQLRRNVRVLVTSHRLLVYSDAGGRQIVLDFEIPLEDAGGVVANRSTLNLSETLKVETADGPVYVHRQQGCGCGSVLKAMGEVVPWRR